MSWLFSRVLVEGFSAGTCSAGGVCAPWSASPMPPVFSWPDRMTGFSRLSRFGMMCEPLMDGHGEGLLTWFRAGFRARTSAALARGRESRGSEAGCGGSLRGSLARWDRDSCLWRTHQFSLLGDLELFSETWPRWGMMRGGECWERTMPGHLTSGTGSGSSERGWTTPSATDGRRGGTITENMTGTSLAQTARAVGEVADAVVIGTRLVQILEGQDEQAAAPAARAFMAEIRQALDEPYRGDGT